MSTWKRALSLGVTREMVLDGVLEENPALADHPDLAEVLLDRTIASGAFLRFISAGCYLLELPDELLLRILDYLKRSELLSLRLVCTELARLVEDIRFWPSDDLYGFPSAFAIYAHRTDDWRYVGHGTLIHNALRIQVTADELIVTQHLPVVKSTGERSWKFCKERFRKTSRDAWNARTCLELLAVRLGPLPPSFIKHWVTPLFKGLYKHARHPFYFSPPPPSICQSPNSHCAPGTRSTAQHITPSPLGADPSRPPGSPSAWPAPGYDQVPSLRPPRYSVYDLRPPQDKSETDSSKK